MSRASRRGILSALVFFSAASTAAVALAAQWQSTCATCGHTSNKYSSKGAQRTCSRIVKGKSCGGVLIWQQVK